LENLSFENHREWKKPVPISIHTQARLSDWKYQLTDAECAQADEKSLLSLVVAGNKSLFKEMVQLITTT